MENLKIIIVEDEASIAESLKDIMEVLNHEVLAIAPSAEEAILALSTSSPDLILLDIQLKGSKMDGVDIAAIIKEKYDVPFIFTTAFADDETIERARNEGPFGYVVKPYGINDIKAAIEVAYSNYTLMKELNTNSPAAADSHNGQLYLKEDGRLVRVNEDDILVVEARGDYMLFKAINGSHTVYSTMKNVLQKLNPNKFLQVHRSFIVNLNHIEDIVEGTLVIGKKVIPISRAKRQELLNRINTI